MQETTYQAGDLPWDRKIPGEGNGNPLQCFYLGNPMDRGTWWTTAHGIVRLSDYTTTTIHYI